MGKSKGQKTTPNQPALVGGAVAAGNASIPSIAVVTGSEGESQGVRVSCSNTKTKQTLHTKCLEKCLSQVAQQW